ncbi:hypothetical protein YDYSY3_49260 [Paenibacillus chitinolyticus]|uniref:DUF1405 domain-containing protein n=1 Tax=Paenibacillus chitinolyticus TaxID=79263 RepID=UPI0026E4FE90|nr:DUF1405 domain-containing protein [Paenibacillus chitinolyticus]GKS13926.1 hypothetical protein YDYSY3_49260 [Paenibacillus chitinolyticus]
MRNNATLHQALTLLRSRPMLWLLFWINALGTVYGYYWYKYQLIDTYDFEPAWYLPFVPDSPTASLFFTLTLLYLLRDERTAGVGLGKRSLLRGFIEAFGLVTSFKYGIWAVAMIWSGYALGDPVAWQDWMLTLSHLGMAIEVLLFASVMTYSISAVLLVAVWAFANDWMDYTKGIFPRLSEVLMPHLDTIQWFTIGLSAAGILVALAYLPYQKHRLRKV